MSACHYVDDLIDQAEHYWLKYVNGKGDKEDIGLSQVLLKKAESVGFNFLRDNSNSLEQWQVRELEAIVADTSVSIEILEQAKTADDYLPR